MNIKSRHKLTEKNYKRLAILSQIVTVIMLNYASPIFVILTIAIGTSFTYMSWQLYWLFYQIVFTPIYIFAIWTITSFTCIIYLYFPYYKLRFDQINQQIYVISNGKSNVINLQNEKRLIKLIYEHNQLAIEIKKFNLIFRRLAAAFFITASLIKIMTLFLMINIKHFIAKLIIINAFFLIFFFGFGMSILFSLQIKSAKNCYEIVHSIICKRRIRLPLKFKLANFIERLIGPPIGLHCYNIAPYD